MRIALAVLLALTSCRGKKPKAVERRPDAAPEIATPSPPPKIDAAPPPPTTADEEWKAARSLYAAGDHADAAKLLDSACKRGHPVACEERAAMHEKGEAGPADPAKALELERLALRLYEEHCAAGAPRSCRELSWWHGTGGYAPAPSLMVADPVRAVALYKKAAELWLAECEAGDGQSCSDADSWIDDGFELAAYAKKEATELRRRHPKGAIFTIACDKGDGYGCYQIGTQAAAGEKQLALYRKSCDLEYHGGCQALGRVFEDGVGVAADPAKGLTFYLRGCDLDVGVCFEACRVGEDIRSPQPAACMKACDAGYWPSACGMGR